MSMMHRFTPLNLMQTERVPALLGKQGENKANTLVFDCKIWKAEYPNAEVVLYVVPPDGETYLADMRKEGDVYFWEISSSDTAKPGNGSVELMLRDTDSGTVLKSATGRTKVLSSLSQGDPGNPPPPHEAWWISVLDKMEHIEDITVTEENVGDVVKEFFPDEVDKALAKAKESGEFDGDPGEKGATGERGKGVLTVATSPRYTETDGERDYRIRKDVVIEEAGVDDVFIGDTIRFESKIYTVVSFDLLYAHLTYPVELKGDKGDKGATGSTGAPGPVGMDGPPGERGTSILRVTTKPIFYSSNVGYYINANAVKEEAGVETVLAGDCVLWDTLFYKITSISGTHVYMSEPINMMGERGKGVLSVKTKPKSFSVNGVSTPGMDLDTIKTEAGVEEVYVGDTVRWESLLYTVKEIRFSSVLFDDPVDLKATNGGGGVDFRTDDTLTLEGGVLSVNTTDKAEEDNTLPITSAGVFAEIGNINALLATI